MEKTLKFTLTFAAVAIFAGITSAQAGAQTSPPPAVPQGNLPLSLSTEDVNAMIDQLQQSDIMFSGPDKAWRPLLSTGAGKVLEMLRDKEVKARIAVSPTPTLAPAPASKTSPPAP